MSQVRSSQLSFQYDGAVVLTPSALWMTAVAPCVLLSLAVGRMLWRRSASSKGRVFGTAVAVHDSVDTMAYPTRQLSLVDATVELLKHPFPSPDTAWYTRVPTRNRRAKHLHSALPLPSSIPDGSPVCDLTRRALPPVAPRIVISPPEDESPLARFLPFKSGWIVPKQNIGGSLLIVPGAPTSSVHFALRLPVH